MLKNSFWVFQHPLLIYFRISGIAEYIFSMNIPYPEAGSFISTCVTAPTRRPFCIIGLPDIPCIIPPVRSSSARSVTRTEKHRPPEAVRSMECISIEYSPISPPRGWDLNICRWVLRGRVRKRRGRCFLLPFRSFLRQNSPLSHRARRAHRV